MKTLKFQSVESKSLTPSVWGLLGCAKIPHLWGSNSGCSNSSEYHTTRPLKRPALEINAMDTAGSGPINRLCLLSRAGSRNQKGRVFMESFELLPQWDNSTISNEEPQESELGRETNQNDEESNNFNDAEVDGQNNENEKETNMYNDNDKGINTDITIALVNAMESEVNRLSTAVIDAKSMLKEFTYNKHFFENNDERVKSYTGLPTFAILWQLTTFLCPSLGQTTSINPFQRVILVLFKLKLNMPNQVLGDMFHVSSSTVSKIFLETLDVMYFLYINLKQLIVWPERENLRKTMPKEFIKVYGRRVTIIIDCFEIFIEKPSSVKSQAETFSSYKHHNAAKYLIGVTPQATVSFLSKGWGGRTNDKHVTETSGFLDNLQHGDLILADREFDISESVALKHAEVKIPAFTKGRKQLPASEIIATRKLARLRIHVERVIGSARNKYSILQSTIPITFLQSRDDDDCVILDKIVTVCFSLLNLCPALVK
ncbi:nuclease harbi1 [Plakobranchus ocellatus]|uniref:Nuclease harbi1 n=1 Tax=Plakobranchus ocellatus TaxID=259542 RepID=A0AAV4DYR9_9GAST|nr:nuclease harbi1 [Plakobranchus ocellatus]